MAQQEGQLPLEKWLCPATLGPGCLGFRCLTCGRATGTYAEADWQDEAYHYTPNEERRNELQENT